MMRIRVSKVVPFVTRRAQHLKIFKLVVCAVMVYMMHYQFLRRFALSAFRRQVAACKVLPVRSIAIEKVMVLLKGFATHWVVRLHAFRNTLTMSLSSRKSKKVGAVCFDASQGEIILFEKFPEPRLRHREVLGTSSSRPTLFDVQPIKFIAVWGRYTCSHADTNNGLRCTTPLVIC